jgi:hypothetical protein
LEEVSWWEVEPLRTIHKNLKGDPPGNGSKIGWTL